MSELEKELKQLRQTCLQMAQENAQITSELENLQTAMVKITEQAIAAVQVTQLQGEQIKRLKDTIAANEMGDELNAADALKASAHDYSQMAKFVSAVSYMRSLQKHHLEAPEEAILQMAKQAEGMVDNAIKNDIFFIELLKMPAPLKLK
jgi:uncharacterized protein YigA (DUF484 family)